MVTAIVIVLIALAAVLAAWIVTRPPTFRVERAVTVAAPPERIHPLIDDFRAWSRWSPYEALDPTMRRTFVGPEAGVGAVYAWAGNGKAGAGRMEILESTLRRVAIRLDFVRPFKARNTAEFKLEPQADGATRLTWAMHGPNLTVGKAMSLFLDMDRMIGRDFEAGLARLKAVAEA